MPTPADRSPRVARATVAALAVTALAVAAHAAGHGTPPPLLALLPVVALVAGVATVAARRRLTAPVLVGLIGSAQLGIHLLSSYLEGGAHHVVHPPSAWMTTAHLVSTCVTALVLAHGERLLWQVAAWLAVVVAVAPAPLPVVDGRPVVARALTPVPLRWSAAPPVRGPPLLAQY